MAGIMAPSCSGMVQGLSLGFSAWGSLGHLLDVMVACRPRILLVSTEVQSLLASCAGYAGRRGRTLKQIGLIGTMVPCSAILQLPVAWLPGRGQETPKRGNTFL